MFGKSIIQAGLRSAVNLGGTRARRLFAEAISLDRDHQLETIVEVPINGKTYKLYCIGDLPVWRAETFFNKEPETIDWIDGMAPGEVLWDIGANVGIYSLYAAAKGVRVLSFEPGSANYYLLNRNIQINRLDVGKQIQAFCFAFADRTILDVLNIGDIRFGGANASFAATADEHGDHFAPTLRQGMIGMSVDGFIETFKPPRPNHIKIDVDGIEQKIVAGARATLADPAVKSVSIELTDDRSAPTSEVMRIMTECGFRLESKRHNPAFYPGKNATIFNFRFVR